ncbi:MAG: DUF2939 domain-containing protein [Acidaminococcaceae bacterium]|jgi:hypothetical protein|nr:DUF2939 domain-containing protein [Acidaminococcaceae bacterium]
MATEEPSKKTHGKILRIFLALIFLAIVGVAAFYKFYWLRSPQYSLGLIQKAIAQHDDAAFEKHVDVSRLSDDMVTVMIDTTVMTGEESGPFKDNFVAMVKNIALPAFNSQIRTYVQQGVFQPIDTNNDGFAIAAAAIERMGFLNMEFKGIDKTARHNDTTVVTCKLYDKALQQEFPLAITMNRLEDGTWRLVHLSGLQTFVKNRDAAVLAKLLELNKPIKEKIGEKVRAVKDGSKTFSIKKVTENESGIPAYAIHATFSFELLDPKVKRVKGQVLVYDAKGTQIFSRDFDSKNLDLSADQQKKWGYSNIWHLNGQDPADKAVIAADFSTTTQDVLFTEVDMEDGSTLKYLTEIPDAK